MVSCQIEQQKSHSLYGKSIKPQPIKTTFEDSEKLIRYLIQNKHWSPFEMVHVVMEIHTTRDIARQILRHRSFSFKSLVKDMQIQLRVYHINLESKTTR